MKKQKREISGKKNNTFVFFYENINHLDNRL